MPGDIPKGSSLVRNLVVFRFTPGEILPGWRKDEGEEWLDDRKGDLPGGAVHWIPPQGKGPFESLLSPAGGGIMI